MTGTYYRRVTTSSGEARKRTCELLYRNVRELPIDSLKAQDDIWRIVIDFPFDQPGFSPKDDLAQGAGVSGDWGRLRHFGLASIIPDAQGSGRSRPARIA